MRYLAVQKIPVIPLADYQAFREGKKTLPPRSVVITIDDGYKTAYTKAWPILRKYGYPFTLYVYPHAISRLPSALTWDNLREMSRAGVDVQSHSFSHPLLTHPGKAMAPAEYEAWLDHELRDSKTLIEEHLRKPVTSLAYPYGGYDERVVERAKAAGYLNATTCGDADVNEVTPALLLHRRLVFRRTSMRAFVQYFRVLPINVTSHAPLDGERLKDIPADVRARIQNVQDLVPESAQILIDKVGGGWRTVSLDPKSGDMRFPVPPSQKRGYYFVSLVARDRQHPELQRETSWSFIVKRNASKY